MSFISKDIWVPKDNLKLEKTALQAIKEPKNFLVVAGPGAGKTELLAQKACYLLETNSCKYPQRILAISFKRDAAFNLKQRVKLRCEDEFSQRFDSLTFDAFAKQILDRFRNALPCNYKITQDYIIVDQTKIKDTVRSIDENYLQTTDLDVVKFLTSDSLPLSTNGIDENIRLTVWYKLLNGTRSQLSFSMIMRLAQLIISGNPLLKKYLTKTYSHIFLDEFQDTNSTQYSFFRTCFNNCEAFYTAVGDDKQRIMGWAGAIPEIFDIYKTDTTAERLSLKMNFRSAPKLVMLQNHLIKNLLNKADFAEPASNWRSDEGEAFVWFFDNQTDEMNVLREAINEWLNTDKVNPRNICILVKQQVDVYTSKLVEYFNHNSIQARNETNYQDLLTDDLVCLLNNFLYSIFDIKNLEAKESTFQILIRLNTIYDDNELLRLHTRMAGFAKRIRTQYASTIGSKELSQIVEDVIEFCGKSKIRSLNNDYKSEGYWNHLIYEYKTFIENELKKGYSLISALDCFTGKNSIPIMTIHKSKGLEYHTVVFIGLEDSAFWSYSNQEDADKCAFFVALSRAKSRVVFTFSQLRENKYGNLKRQSFSVIEDLFTNLESSGLVQIQQYKN